jgi:hypothetical protein
MALAMSFVSCSGDDAPLGPVAVTSVTISSAEMTLTVGGDNGTLTAAVLPSNASQSVTWYSSAPVVASVAGAGATVTISPLAFGTAAIFVASTADPTKAASCTVTVGPAPFGVTIDLTTLRLAPNATRTLTAGVLPAGAGQAVVWASDDERVATVVGDGVTATVTAVADGRTRITATAAGFPAVFGVCDVTVGFPPVTMARTIAGGIFHSLAIKADGTLWAWGYNDSGQLGDGSTTDRDVPTKVGTDSDWVAVTAGEASSLAIQRDGSLWAWGMNWGGQLGLGDNSNNRNAPTRVGAASDWTAVSAGFFHTVAIKADGGIWTWGDNGDGQLGDGTTTAQNVPGRVGAGTDWASATAGYYHTLAIKTDGGLWAWGDNYWGELGLGEMTDGTTTPKRVGIASDWAAVAARLNHTMAIKENGGLWAWGYNRYGPLGGGDTTNRYVPESVDNANDWAAVAAREYYTLAVKTDGSLWAWGDNESGRLGLGDTTNRYVPTKVGDGWRVPAK